jgi:NAD-dependent dihydropyrimidine dehydrogenase PreA subunit
MKRKIIEIDESKCNGCGQCVTACAEGALKIIDGKAKLVSETYCDGLGACIGDCPMDAIRIVEREAPAFVEPPHLKAAPTVPAPHSHGGFQCPSSKMRQLQPTATADTESKSAPSALGNWPIKIRLVSPSAPYLQNADLLILADCVGMSYPALHQNLLPGRILVSGCPKFDDTELYLERLTEIFELNSINSVTVAMMEVPCCQGMLGLVMKAAQAAGRTIPLRKVVVSLSGAVLQDTEITC